MPANIYSLDENFPQSSIETISNLNKQRLDQTYEELLGNSKNKDKIEKLVKETREMIPQIDERIHYWEDRRTQFLQLSVGILAAALTGIIALFPQIISEFDKKEYFSITTILFIPVIALSICLLVGCTQILILWNKQNNPPYPFTKGTQTWRWQYRHAETTPTDTDFIHFNSKAFEEQAYIFANNLIDYKIKTITSEIKELLDQDLSQLYLLLINEKFKIKFVSKLRDMLINWLLISGIAALIFLVIMILGLFIKK